MDKTSDKVGWILIALAFAVIIGIFGKAVINDSPNPNKAIIGQWELTDNENNDYVRMINDDFPVDNIYFYGDGQMTMNGVDCTYSITNDEFIISSFFGGTNHYTYSINNDALTLKRTNGLYADVTAYYEKVD